MTNVTILDRPLHKTKGAEANFSSFAQLYSGYIILSKDIVDDINELEKRYKTVLLLHYFNSQIDRDWQVSWIATL